MVTLFCLIGRHARSPDVWWDGFDFRSECRHCRVPLYKHGNVKWRRLDARQEARFLRYREGLIELAPDSRAGSAKLDGTSHLERHSG